MRTIHRFCLLAILLCCLPAFAQTAATPAKQGIDDVMNYISSAWGTLTRSMEDCKSVTDERRQKGRAVLYFPADSAMPSVAADLEKRCGIEPKALPQVIKAPGTFDMSKIEKHGLLYLPHPYVVPGGFLNEMYGWDSYFIIRGLLQARKADLARGMVENFFYEIEHYGEVLNANRTYFLTRSQPPFLSSMVLAVYDDQKAAGHDDKQWLERAYPFIVRDHDMWVSGQHLAGDTGLSRYFDFGSGPTTDISDTGNSYYADVLSHLLQHPDWAAMYEAFESNKNPAIGPTYAVSVCTEPKDKDKACADTEHVRLTGDYYDGDRAMRESGFDISFRFGPYSGSTTHYAPVCLNSLLYKTEKDLERISNVLGRGDDARKWSAQAEKRAAQMNRYFWNASTGEFFDYDFTTGKQSDYEYASTFYPLWTGWASKEQASAVIKNEQRFEQPGGLVTSRHETGVQWDYPYGWAPLQLIAVEGLRSFGADEQANRLSYGFLSTIVANFRRDGTIREKYNVVTKSDEAKNFTAGYRENVIGFGWTNGTFLTLLTKLPQEMVARLGGVKANEPAAGK